jgi:putative PIN family toxin of toxin-antitoxin system
MDLKKQRLVLDTNVCLDLFAFRDPRWADLLGALQAGTVEAVTGEECRAEWQRVLHYPQVPVDDLTRASVSADFDRLIRVLPAEALLPPEGVRLPVCADKDDQKFLELALAAGADVLITKDNELLKLARKTARAGLFSIIAPEAWVLPVSA